MTPQPVLQDIILVDTEDDIKKYVRDSLVNSNCLKTRTAAAIARYEPSLNKYRILSIGCNSCAPADCEYGQTLRACPRSNIKTGTSYELCAPLHAERMACLNIRAPRESNETKKFASHLQVSEDEILSAFSKDELEKLKKATLYLAGHYWSCEGCVYFLKTVGITEIKLDAMTAETTKQSYESKRIQ